MRIDAPTAVGAAVPARREVAGTVKSRSGDAIQLRRSPWTYGTPPVYGSVGDAAGAVQAAAAESKVLFGVFATPGGFEPVELWHRGGTAYIGLGSRGEQAFRANDPSLRALVTGARVMSVEVGAWTPVEAEPTPPRNVTVGKVHRQLGRDWKLQMAPIGSDAGGGNGSSWSTLDEALQAAAELRGPTRAVVEHSGHFHARALRAVASSPFGREEWDYHRPGQHYDKQITLSDPAIRALAYLEQVWLVEAGRPIELWPNTNARARNHR